MWNFKRNRKQVPKYLKQNKKASGAAPSPGKSPLPGKPRPAGKVTATDLEKVQKNITRQALLAGLTVVLTIVILFAMTSAWYTNIVQTSGLVFEAESWGFDGEITVNEEAIEAAPGDEGLVQLTVQNTSTNVSAISVNVNKLGMREEMQQRLFFYVDTQMNRDGETMERVYLNNQEGYTYTVFSNGTLTLTEKASNAPQLKWQWVYDVLGYYVLAQPQYDADGNFSRMSVKEYLRPIEYDYDEATLVMDEDENKNPTMRITTVDGTTTPENFLKALSLKDGYEGEVDTNNPTPDGYYPVNIDKESGYGVYAYLCTYGQIENATVFDTKLGKLANLANKKKNEETLSQAEEELLQNEEQLLRHTATLNISAQKNESTAVNVTTLSALQNAITEYKADVIQLSDNITIPSGESMTIPKDTRVMVDLNGHTITSASNKAIVGEPGSSLTLLKGDLTGPGGDSTAISMVGAEVVMNGVNVSGFRYGVYPKDHTEGNALDSRIHMVDCTVEADWYAVYINGNGDQSNQKTQLIIQNSTLAGGGYAITGSGNANRAGTDIQILESTIIQGTIAKPDTSGTGAAIFQPQKNSTLYIYKSTVTGYTAIALKGGLLDIVDSTISGVGAVSLTPEKASDSGFVDTADAVYIEANYGYEIGLQISCDSTLTSTNAQSLRVFPADATNVSVKIYSGEFDQEQPPEYIAEGSTQSGSTVTVQNP